MHALLLAVAIVPSPSDSAFRSRALQEWPAAMEKLKAVGETYKKWGITFKVKDQKEWLAENAPLPGRFTVSGSIDSDSSLHLDIKTHVGEKHALSFETTGKFSVDAEGVASKGSISTYVGGHGIGGTIEGSRAEGYKMEAGVEESIYSVGVRFGKSDQGPLVFGLNFGPLTVEVDPTKYVKRMIDVGPEIVKKAGEKIGGVTMQVDADAMAYALASASEPPPDFLSGRKLVSLKSLIGKDDPLGDLNEIEGALVDSENHDIFLVGEHDPATPIIPVERVATVERTVYEQGEYPAISIDRQMAEPDKPHRGRIDHTPDDLRKSSLIGTMFAADYAMKQLTLGVHKIEGFKCISDIILERKVSIVPTRFWIHPAPLKPGDIEVSESGGRRLYTVSTEPVVLTASDISRSESEQFSKEEEAKSDDVSEQEARELTVKFREIEKAWPESQFSEARHDIQLTNLFSVLRAQETEPWATKLLHDFGSRAIPEQEFPLEFPALAGESFVLDGMARQMKGGMVTAVEQSTPIRSSAGSDVTGADLSRPAGEIAAGSPVADMPTGVSDADESDRAFWNAIEGIKALDWKRAETESRRSAALQPKWAKAKSLHLTCLSYLDPNSFASDGFSSELAAGKALAPEDWQFPFIESRQESYLAGSTAIAADKTAHRQRAIAAVSNSLQLTQSEPSLYRIRAALEYRLGQRDAALADWNKAIAGNPADGLAYQQRAGYYAALGKKEECFKDLISALRYAASPTEPLVYLTIWSQKFNEPDFAKYMVDLLMSMPFSDWRVYDAVGQVCLGSKDVSAMAPLIYADMMFQKATNPGADPLSPPKYPKEYKPVDLWDDFVNRSGDRPDRSESPQGAIEFDPMMPYSIGKAALLADDYASALQYLTAALPYLPSRKTEIAALIEDCKKKLPKPPAQG
jgi:tetratricopeptide (TPR) repeat protein